MLEPARPRCRPRNAPRPRRRLPAAAPTALVLALLSAGCGLRGAEEVTDLDPQARAFLAGMMEEEDRRPAVADAEALRSGTESDSVLIRAFAARGLGRLEDPEAIGLLAGALGDDSPAVRVEAANGIAQSVSNQDAGAAADLLRARLADEQDAAVRGAIAYALGRLRPSGPDALEQARDTLVAMTRDAPIETLLPTMRGLESLARANRADVELDDGSRSRLAELTRYGRSGAEGFVDAAIGDEPAAEARTAAARVRRLALATLVAASAADVDSVETALYDPDPEVRRLAAAAAGNVAEPTMQALLLRAALADDSAQVRYAGLAGYGRGLRASMGCGPILDALEDEDPHVALLAVDLLASGCDSVAADADTDVAALLSSMALSLPGLRGGEPRNSDEVDRGGGEAVRGADAPGAAADSPASSAAWHRGAHALVALARLDPDAATALIPAFSAHPTWQVRMYAARAAATAGAIDALQRLVADTHPNVAEAALRGLAGQDGATAAGAAIRALERDDYQLLITAANSLADSTDGRALPALLDALARITAQQRQTSRDPRRALLERIGALGTAAQADALRPYLRDFDPLIAGQAAEILLAWTGSRAESEPRPPAPQPYPTLDELLELQRSRALIHLQDGVVVEMRLHAFEAPTNVARFARQARAGYFEGLTFHRVVPNFVIQGGSPGANEYVGAGSFSRDELGTRSHLRGTVGISTRGRDTGDAQIFVNLVDNVRLDHDYTIIGTVTDGMGAVDAVLEGATIARIDIEPLSDRD